MTDLTISIVTANNRDLILDCLRSIYENIDGLNTEVFVVINNSSDDSEEAVRERFPDVGLLVNDRKLGFTHNHNMIMKRGRGKYVLVLNDDTVILNNALKIMVDYMEGHPDAGVLGCRLLNPDGSLQWSCGKSSSHRVEHFKTGVLQSFMPFLRKRDFYSIQEVSWVTGACLMVRAEALLEVGLFDENIIIYYEDGDLCWRMQKAGWKVIFNPEAKVLHYVGKTREKDLLRDLNIIYLGSRYYFFRKHYGPGVQLAVRLITVVELLIQNVRYLVLLAICGDARSGTKKRLRAYWTILCQALGLEMGAGR